MTSTLKERKTMKIRLKNGLEAYLISDPAANKSAAALAVKVGSWQDPVKYPGTAHFCEHMLFMGSKKYPLEDGFFHMVADSGGSANAYTWTDRTVYGFSSNHKQFCQNLDVFAHFFIDPLFDPSAVSRELLAVNQEFAKNLENDGWRDWQILKEMGNQKHPNSKFSTGNEETLKVIPIDTLANWYRLHYSADKMHLVVYSNQDLSVLKEIVNTAFYEVPTANAPSIPQTNVLSEDQKGVIVYVEPICDVRQITFSWEMPAEIASDVDAKIPELIAYTLSYQGEGSLFEELYRESLAESVRADVLRMRNDQAILQFSIDLTKKGVASIDQVIEETYGSIKLLEKNGVPHYVFQEMKKMGETNYKWQQRSDEFQFAMSSVSEMVDENLETYPYKSKVIQTIKPAAISLTLSQMKPRNTLITVIAPPSLTKVTPDRQEKWLGGKYCVVQMNEERLDFLTAITPNSRIDLPAPNPFLPGELVVKNSEQKPEQIKPQLLADDTFGKCYFMEDKHYLAPEIVMKFGLKSPAIKASARSCVMTDVATSLLNRKLITMTSEASRGGIHTYIRQEDLKLVFTIRGPGDKCGLVLNNITDGIKTLCPTRKEFELVKESLLSDYQNSQKALAFAQAKEMLDSIMYNNSFTGKDLSIALYNLNFEEYLLFNEELIQSAYVEGVISGNLSENDANSYWLSLKTSLNPSVYPVSEHNEVKVALISKDNGPYTISATSEMQGNASILMIQFPTTSIAKIASQEILSQVLWSSFFDTLRTKQQTGYITKAWIEEQDDKIMLFFGVHSTTHYPQELLARFELYLEEFVRNYEKEIPKERFNSLKETVITKLSKPPTNLSYKTGQLYFLAFNKNGDFEKRQRTIEAIKSLQYEQFKEDVASFVTRNNTKRLAILVSGKTGREKSFNYKAISYEQAKSF